MDFYILTFQIMASKCRCDSEPCAGVCPCFKTGNMCTNACHMGKPWESVPCLNTEHGLKVKTIKQVEARLALSAAGLSPVGDRHELLKRLAVHYSKEEEKRKKERKSRRKTNAENMQVLLQDVCKQKFLR